MVELTPKDYDLDTGEFIWSSHRGPLVLFGVLSSIWVLAWLVIVHKYKIMKLDKIVSLIEELGSLKTACMREGRYPDEIQDSERQFISKRLGQKVSPYMDESRKQELREYERSITLHPKPFLSRSDKIALSRFFSPKSISFNWVKKATYLIYWIGTVTFVISIALISISLILDLISDWSSTISSQRIFPAIIGIVYLPTFFLLFFFIRKWKKGYKQSLKEQMNLLTDICENADNIEEIERRLTQFILTDISIADGLRNKEGNIPFPYLMFKRTNTSWNFDMLSIPLSRYDYMYFLYFIFILPLFLILFNLFVEFNEQISTPLAIFLNTIILISYFIGFYFFFFLAVLVMRFLIFLLLTSFFNLDTMSFSTKREGRVPEAYERTKRQKQLLYTSAGLIFLGLAISITLFVLTSSPTIFILILFPSICPFMLFFFFPTAAERLRLEPKAEKKSDIRYISRHQMYTKGFFAQYLWEVILAFILFVSLFLFIVQRAFLLFSGDIITSDPLFFAFSFMFNVSFIVAFVVSFLMSGFFVYYFTIELFKTPINTALSTILEEKEIKMMTSLSDSAIIEDKDKERLEFRFSILDAGKNFVEKYKRGRQWERLRAIVTSIFSYVVSLVLDYSI